MKTSRTAIARIAASTAKPSVPCRVERILRRPCMCISSARHDRNTGAEGGEVARRRTTARVERLDVLDEVPDDQAGIVSRHRVVTIALARIGEVPALARPAGDVEGGEARDRHDAGSRSAE